MILLRGIYIVWWEFYLKGSKHSALFFPPQSFFITTAQLKPTASVCDVSLRKFLLSASLYLTQRNFTEIRNLLSLFSSFMWVLVPSLCEEFDMSPSPWRLMFASYECCILTSSWENYKEMLPLSHDSCCLLEGPRNYVIVREHGWCLFITSNKSFYKKKVPSKPKLWRLVSVPSSPFARNRRPWQCNLGDTTIQFLFLPPSIFAGNGKIVDRQERHKRELMWFNLHKMLPNAKMPTVLGLPGFL